MDIEQTLIAWLSEKLQIPVSGDVPEDRPKKFLTVERTGGGDKNVAFEAPQIAIQCWAQTRYEAAKFADEVSDIMPDFSFEPHIHSVYKNSHYNFPDPDSRMGRYQILYQLVTRY